MEHLIDREKVIKGLECCAGQCNYHGCPYKDPCENAKGVKQIMLDALTLLKEQEAVEPIPYHRSDGTIFKYECRKCRTKIFKNDLFCRHCGQVVKWE